MGVGYCLIAYIAVNCVPVLLVVCEYGQRKCICHVEAKRAVFYIIHSVHVLTINISSNICILWYTIYDT